MKHFGKKKEVEVFDKAYVDKTNLGSVQVFPVPTDLENWIEIDFDPEFNYRGKIYDIDTGEFTVCEKRKSKVVLNKRKQAYAERSDPLFLEWQFDKTDSAERVWREEVLAIKGEYPLAHKGADNL
jgi:hypothetical protein